jgi:hypothetical protein
MAARNSCTHITWGEAKAKVAGNNAPGKKKPIPKNTNHGAALTAKIISKNGASQQDLSQHRASVRKGKRVEERAAVVNAKRAEERERERSEQVVKPHEQARERLKELALQHAVAPLVHETTTTTTTTTSDMDLSQMKQIAECKQMQLDEIMALEAIFVDTEEFLVSEASSSEELREKIEAYEMDEENEALLQSVVEHPPVSLYLQLTIDDTNNSDLAASVLLHATYPPLYPLGGSTPQFEISYFMVTNQTTVCSADKPLESLAYLEETKLQDAFKMEAEQILPDPCVYEVAVSWLPENLFGCVTMHTHLQHVK